VNFHKLALKIAASKKAKPLSPEEKKELGIANTWIMDEIMDGSDIPKEMEDLGSASDPEKARKIIEYVKSKARGNIWD